MSYERFGKWFCVAMWFLCQCCAVSEAALGLGKSLATNILQMENVTDFGVMTVFVFIGYMFQVAGLGGLFELTNPNGYKILKEKGEHEKSARRYKQVQAEIRMGLTSLAITVLLTVAWMKWGEPKTYFYGFFETHTFNIWWALSGIAAYVWWFDIWFYWSHRWLHDIDWLWNNVHYHHHRFKEPSAFAQFAVHPIESALQGPVGHYMGTLFFPFHPVQLAVMGFLSSAWAVAAHDGRQLDFNNHFFHHSKGRGRFVYFNLGFLTPFWDVLCGTRWHEEHPMWQKWKTGRGKTQFDTMTGTKQGETCDVYSAYKDGDYNCGDGKKGK